MAVVLLLVVVIAGLSFTRVEEASATFTHSWNLWASGGVGGSPVSLKECGLWDNAPGSTVPYKKCAVLWLEADNGGSGQDPYENEWVRFITTQVDVDPAAGWKYIRFRFNMGANIRFGLGVIFSSGWRWTYLNYGGVDIYQWRTLNYDLETTKGSVVGIWVEINDDPNTIGTPKDWYMVLLDFIQIRNAAGAVIWSEEF